MAMGSYLSNDLDELKPDKHASARTLVYLGVSELCDPLLRYNITHAHTVDSRSGFSECYHNVFFAGVELPPRLFIYAMLCAHWSYVVL